jgi:hypothetical protein
MNVKRTKDKIIIEIPYWTKRFNPYMVKDDGTPENVGSHPTLIGLLTRDQWGNDECGFAYVIDMDYKDKGDQNTGIMIQYMEGDEKFKKVCEEIKIGWINDRNADPDTDYEND